jgi:hypothetical protein
MIRKHKEPTCVRRVEDALREADDFLTASLLAERTGLDGNHVNACVWHLAKYKAIEGLRVDDTLWWFLTPETDQRIRKVAERTPEGQPRKPRKRKSAGGLGPLPEILQADHEASPQPLSIPKGA